MSKSFAAIVKKIKKDYIIVETVVGGKMKIPRFYGEAPMIGDTIIVDMTGGGAGRIYSAPSIAEVGEQTRYLNFYSIEDDGNEPDVKLSGGDLQLGNSETAKKTKIAPYSPFGFVDLPAGSRTMDAGNGNVIFASKTSVGMATSCQSKMIFRDNGTAEFATPHFMGLIGRTVVVSTFQDDLSIEIDISTKESSGGTRDINTIKNSIAKLVIGEDGDPISYEEAFEQAVTGSQNEQFYRIFGLHLGEILLTFKWRRFKYIGSEKVFHEVFSTLGMFDTLYQYCLDCYGKNNIVMMEFFLKDNTTEKN